MNVSSQVLLLSLSLSLARPHTHTHTLSLSHTHTHTLTEFLCVFVISRLSLSQARGENKIFCDTKTYETLKNILKSAKMGLVRQSCSTIPYQNRNNNNNKNKNSNKSSKTHKEELWRWQRRRRWAQQLELLWWTAIKICFLFGSGESGLPGADVIN